MTDQRRVTWKKNNPDKVKLHKRRSNLKMRYGITPDIFEKMVNDRDGLCDICKQPARGKSNSSIKLNIDHTVVDNKIIIRGLLCWQCNVAIGYLAHDIVRLHRAIEYLEKTDQ